VVSDNGGPITIDFVNPIVSFGGFFTYLEPLTLAGFDAADIQVATASSAYSTNDALFGDPGSSPNESLAIHFPSGMVSVTITGGQAGGSFALDDATYRTKVPEPNTLSTILICVIILFLKRKYKTVTTTSEV